MATSRKPARKRKSRAQNPAGSSVIKVTGYSRKRAKLPARGAGGRFKRKARKAASTGQGKLF